MEWERLSKRQGKRKKYKGNKKNKMRWKRLIFVLVIQLNINRLNSTVNWQAGRMNF